jgi:UDPglucose--hexose-1-phosphate uridylyltransferase
MTDAPPPIREIRINPIVPTESVLVATARGMRPREAEERVARDTRNQVDTCPFCRGNEARTPPSLRTYPEVGPWDIRIVENLYPVLGDDRQQSNLAFGLQQVIDGYGRHEVVIDHPHHGISVHEMRPGHLAQLFRLVQTRMGELYGADPRLSYVLLFKNFGRAAGASIAHTHSQLIAMPVVPQNLHNELHHSRAYFLRHNQCVFCSLIDEALTFEATIYDRQSGAVRRRIDVGQYLVERGERFVAIKPFASRFEWEVHILPLDHQADFLQTPGEALADFAAVLQRTMARLDWVIGGAQYNYFLHSQPRSNAFWDHATSFHWHLEICPRTSIPTGFELGSGLFVSTLSPEYAAARLRAVMLD